MEIVWSKLAYEHFLEILIYVENNFGKHSIFRLDTHVS